MKVISILKQNKGDQMIDIIVNMSKVGIKSIFSVTKKTPSHDSET